MRTIHCPEPTPESRPFFEATGQSRLLFKRCGSCGEPHFYPRTRCPFCFSADTAWEASAGKGSIYTFSVLLRGAGAPFAIGYVTLDEGVTVLTNFVDCNLEALEIGMRVQVTFVRAESGVMVPMFTTANDVEHPA